MAAPTGRIDAIPDEQRAALMSRLIKAGEEKRTREEAMGPDPQVRFQDTGAGLPLSDEDDYEEPMRPTPDLRRRLQPARMSEIPPEDAFFLPPPAPATKPPSLTRYLIAGAVGLFTGVIAFFVM